VSDNPIQQLIHKTCHSQSFKSQF